MWISSAVDNIHIAIPLDSVLEFQKWQLLLACSFVSLALWIIEKSVS